MIIRLEFKGRFVSFKPIQTLDFFSFRRESCHLQKQLWSTGAQFFSATICTDYSFSCLLFVLIYLWFPPEYLWNNFLHFIFIWREWREINQVTVWLTLLASQKIPNANLREITQIPREKNKTVQCLQCMREQLLLLQACLVSTTTLVRAYQQRQICAAVIIWLTHINAHLEADAEAFRSASPLRAWSTSKEVQCVWLQWGWAAGCSGLFTDVISMGAHETGKCPKTFHSFSIQWSVKRYTTLFMLFIDTFLCKRDRRPWCYVENGTHPWHRPAQAPGTCEYGSVQLLGTGQLYLDFLQCTSPRHQDDLARTSHTQRLKTKLNIAPVWVCKAQNAAEARSFCCISLYGCMCCMNLQGPNLQERANIFRTVLQKAHIRNFTAYHSPTSCVWGRRSIFACCLAGRDNSWGWREEVMDNILSWALAPHHLHNLLPGDIWQSWLWSTMNGEIGSCWVEYVHVFQLQHNALIKSKL